MGGLEVRPCGPSETESWARFLDQNFGYQAPHSYAVDFAPLFGREALERSRLLFKEGRIVASAALHPVEVVTPSRRLRLGVVGAVATDEKERGNGFSRNILAELESLAREAGLEGLILWSDQAGFYEKSGYSAVGRQLIYSLADLPAPKLPIHGAPVYGWDWKQVRSLYEAHRLRIARTEEYWRAIESVKSVTRVQWVDPDGSVRAYLGFDRGHDLKDIVHEWGGEAEALHRLLWTVLQSRPRLMWLTHPALVDPIAKRFLTEGPLVDGTLALFKPLGSGIAFSELEQAWFWGLDSL